MLSKNDEAKLVLYNALPKKEYERIFMYKTAKEVWNSLVITHQGNKQVKDNKMDLFVQQYEQFIILDDETIDCVFSRFSTIVTSLKALNESFSSRNHVWKFLKALLTKWRQKVTAIKESKVLSTLLLDELIGNLKVYEVVLKKDSEASKNKKENYKSLALKEKKVSSNKEYDKRTSEEKRKSRKEKRSEGCWSDSDKDDDSKKDKICLVAQYTNEVRLKVKLKSNEWIKDSRRSRHMTGNKDLFSTYEAINGGNMVFGSNTKSKIIGKGTTFDKTLKPLPPSPDLNYCSTVHLFYSSQASHLVTSLPQASNPIGKDPPPPPLPP
nr:DUF4219 domain-containing protein/UBN2 domain-containing protein [Tanacetum cinerariifolium]